MASAEAGEEPWLQDGSCDACEPDEAQSAAQACLDCGFSFCPLHAQEHRQRLSGHRMADLAAAAGGGGRTGGPRREAQRRSCQAHQGQALSLYCQQDQALVCVLCAVAGPHRQHPLATLQQAFQDLRNKEPVDLKVAMLEMVKRLKFKCADPKVTQGDMKQCIRQEFNKVRSQICEEERRALHLVDVKEALITAHTTETLADIDVRKAKLMTEMAELTRHLNTFNELALLKPKSADEETRDSRYNDDDPSPANGPC
ncbi:tripartite motif-containing protein 44 isoform X2 [Sceloporus undulatus]|uniref:tripartite motif-containing protein 44 isoform X2 n=1 Tax=Sceloporus undulatus TaxID=8520 RepID=UPI001C4B8AFC|nr:tripartite motif-containing protein 44 isoform X2 [Sceloporus undulatus]